jgi:hypothetical protein
MKKLKWRSEIFGGSDGWFRLVDTGDLSSGQFMDKLFYEYKSSSRVIPPAMIGRLKSLGFERLARLNDRMIRIRTSYMGESMILHIMDVDYWLDYCILRMQLMKLVSDLRMIHADSRPNLGEYEYAVTSEDVARLTPYAPLELLKMILYLVDLNPIVLPLALSEFESKG